MANIRCPMCSKINPPDAQVCAYCGARLKPVKPAASSEPEKPAANTPSEPSGGEPDWLSQFRSDEPAAPAKGAPQASEPSGPAGEDMPDWLSRIRDRARTETSSTPSELFKEEPDAAPDWMQGTSNESSADLGGDWLSRLQDDAGTPSAATPAAGQGSAPLFADADQEDWLRGLTDNTAAGSSDDAPMFDFSALSDETPAQGSSKTPSTSPGSAGEDDWMSKLSAWQTDSGQVPAGQEPAASEGTDDFGWLNNLGPADQPPQAVPPAAEPSGFGLTSFLTGLEQPPAEPPTAKQGAGKEVPQEPSGFGLTGFLSGLDQTGAPQEPPAGMGEGRGSAGAQIFGEGELQWNPPEEPAAGTSSDELNFADLFSDAPQGAQPATGEYNESAFTGWNPEANAERSDLPDWLGSAPSAATPAGPAAEDSGMPDWLRAMESESSPGAAETQPPAGIPAPAEDSSVPDWLRGISAAPEAAQPVEESPAGGETGLPSWLDGLDAPAAPEPPVQPDMATPSLAMPSEEGNLPDWLASFDQPAGAAAAAPDAEPESLLPSAETGAAPVEGLPDWFASVAPTNVEKTQPYRTGGLKSETPPEGVQPPAGPVGLESAAQSAEPGAEDENVPNWLRAFHDQPDTGESVPPLIGGPEAIENPAVMSGEQPFAMDLPDWLSEESKSAEARDQQTAEPSGEQLAQAELPEWVKEMRPIESIIPGEAQMAEADQRVEKAGPLAGMRGVLPVEDLVTRYRKPPTYSVKLRVSEKQRSQSSIFDSILQQESQPLLIPPERSFAPGAMLRLLIALLLIAALFIPIFMGGSFAPLASPAIYPAELQKMFNQIDQNTQSSSAPVLLAVDYEPGLSGEMRISSLGVIKHLMSKNVPIVVISTVPTGPALAQQLLSEAQVSNTAYDLKQQVLNLGYLPGGTMSLLEFAQLPRFAAPVTLAGASAWQNTFISEISSLQGFSQVIVLTDRAETGRAWVEQVEPSMGNVPLYMVASAQASPLLFPYYESGQIDGMVSGQLGGAMYSQQARQENTPALNYLAAYQVGLLLAFGLVLVGGLVSGSMALFKRGKKGEE